MLGLAGPDTRVMDVQGKTVVPGFIDTHVHPESTIASSGSDDGMTDAERQEVLDVVDQSVAELKAGKGEDFSKILAQWRGQS